MQRLSEPRNDHAPGQRGSLTADREKITELECPNNARIEAIERRVADLEKREPVTITEIQTTDIVPRETDTGRIEFIVKRLNAVEARLTELESRPVVSEETIRQLNDALHAKMATIIEQHVNRALGDLRSRVVTIEKTSSSVTTNNSDPDSDKLCRISEIVGSLGTYVREIESTVDQKHSELEQRYAELAEHITDNNLQTMKLNTRLYRALAALEHDEEAA